MAGAEHLLLTFLVGCLLPGVSGVRQQPAVPNTCLSHPGDVNLGLLTGFLYPGYQDQLCDITTIYPYAYISLQYYEAFRHTLEEVNRRQDLLPNVTLGYTIHDTCWSELVALAKAQLLVPPPEDIGGGQCPARTVPGVGGFETCGSGPVWSRVVGVVDPPSSPENHLVAPLLGLYEIPVLSTQATSDELSDKAQFPFFSRLVPPDSMLIEVMFDFLRHFNWTYVSVLYTSNKYGENAAKVTRKLARDRGVCLPVFERMSIVITKEEAATVARELKRDYQARAVLLFISDVQRIALYDAIDELGLRGHFVFLASDLMLGSDDGIQADGTFMITPFIAQAPDFEDYIKGISPATHGESPWVMAFWEYHFQCKWGEDVPRNQSCKQFFGQSIKDLATQNVAQSLYIDAVLTYAHALHSLIQDACPEVFLTGHSVGDCINGKELLRHIRNVSFLGHNGIVEFDENGDRLGKFSIQQYHYGSANLFVEIATWDKQADVFDILENVMRWPFVSDPQYTPRSEQDGKEAVVPMSVCSLPCGPKQYSMQLESPCCWQCISCAVNHRLNENQTACEPCPPFTWPDDDTAMVCEPIEPQFLKWSDPVSIVFACLALLGLALALLTAVWLLKSRKVKLIKASSIQLTFILLTGIFFAYATTMSLLATPSKVSCILRKFSFGMSTTLMFVPLLLKTIRIHRVFKAGQEYQPNPPLTSNRAQVVGTTALVLVQMVLMVGTEIFMPSSDKLRMRVPVIKEVELLCGLVLASFLPPMTFNLLIIFLCAVFAFLVRKLPQNFNESWYLFVCITCTLFLWVVFLPTYFTTYYAVYQVVQLVSCLLINTAVIHLCIFAPKAYAMYFADVEALALATGATSSSQVAPMPGGPSTVPVTPGPFLVAPAVTPSTSGHFTLSVPGKQNLNKSLIYGQQTTVPSLSQVTINAK